MQIKNKINRYDQNVKIGAQSVPVAMSVCFKHEKALLKNQVARNRTLFRAKKLRSCKQGCLHSSHLRSSKTVQSINFSLQRLQTNKQREEKIMKNTMLKTIGMMALAIMMLTAFTQISVSAQDEEIKTDDRTQEEDAEIRRSNSRKIEGSWNHQVRGLNCTTGDVIRTFQAMFTYNRGGTFWEAGTGTDPKLRGGSHGVWNYESNRRYSTAFQFFRFNPDGTPAGRQIIRQQIRLSADGNSYTATAIAQILDVNGNILETNCSDGTAVRFQ